MTGEILGFRRCAQEIRAIRTRIDRIKYNAPRMSVYQRNEVSTAYGELVKAAQILDNVADDIEDAVWGKAQEVGRVR